MTVALSRRQEDVCKLICRGLAKREIAKRLGISPRTVEDHRMHILRKYRVKTAVQLVLKVNGLPMEIA